jgi:hypothetical protein
LSPVNLKSPGTINKGKFIMNLDSVHPLYTTFSDWWEEMADAIEGQSAIIDAGETYLPQPGGMKFLSDPTAAYAAYQARATYPEIVAPTVRGLSGVIHKEPVKFQLPKPLEPLIEKATVDGLTLESFARRLTRSVLSYGRLGAAVTIDDAGSPVFADYAALSVINWTDDESLVVLKEDGYEINENLDWLAVEQRLLIRKSATGVEATRYTKTVGDWIAQEPVLYNKTGGGAVDFLPFVFIDTNDLTPEPDEVPLLPLARLAAKMFRQDANYQQTLYLSANPQHVIVGMSPDDEYRPKATGGGVIWYLPDPQMRAEILEFTGASAGAQRQAIQDTLASAIQAGARLFASQDEQQESGEARKIKYAAQTATLTGIALTVAAGLEKLLRMAAVIAGANPEEVVVEIDTDFIDSKLAAQEIMAIIQAAASGIISDQTGYEQMQAGGRANPERTWEEEKELISQQGPALGMIGRDSDDGE